MNKAKIRHDRNVVGCNFKKGDKVWKLLESRKKVGAFSVTDWSIRIKMSNHSGRPANDASICCSRCAKNFVSSLSPQCFGTGRCSMRLSTTTPDDTSFTGNLLGLSSHYSSADYLDKSDFQLNWTLG